jgi:hypothetical protein
MRLHEAIILVTVLLAPDGSTAHEGCPLHAAGGTQAAGGAAAPTPASLAGGTPTMGLLATADGVRVFLTRPDGRPVPMTGATGTVVVTRQMGGFGKAPLAPAGDALAATVRIPEVGTWSAEVTVTVDGATERATFVAARPGVRPPRQPNPAADGVTVVLTGEIAQISCERLHVEEGKSRVACARGGALPVLRAGGRLWTLIMPADAPTALAARLARVTQRVRVEGRVRGTEGVPAIVLTNVVAEHDHEAAPNGGVVGMQGDRHLELVVANDGTLRVYVLDSFMTPIPVADGRGSVIVRTHDGRARHGKVTAAPDGAFLVVDGVRRGNGDEDVTVDVTVGGERVAMTLPFAPR